MKQNYRKEETKQGQPTIIQWLNPATVHSSPSSITMPQCHYRSGTVASLHCHCPVLADGQWLGQRRTKHTKSPYGGPRQTIDSDNPECCVGKQQTVRILQQSASQNGQQT